LNSEVTASPRLTAASNSTEAATEARSPRGAAATATAPVQTATIADAAPSVEAATITDIAPSADTASSVEAATTPDIASSIDAAEESAEDTAAPPSTEDRGDAIRIRG